MNFTATSCTDITGHPFIRVHMEDEGKTILRNLTVSQFIGILGESVDEEREYVLLKDDFFPETSRAKWFSNYNNYACVWEEPAKVRLMILKTPLGEKHFHVPFPRLIFRIEVKNGMVVSKNCYAMKKGSDLLCHYPFGNVAQGGGICMGNISAKDMQKVSDFSDAFFSGVTNNDYYGQKGNGKVAVEFSQEKLLEKLSGLESFPDSFLVEDEEHTLKGLIERSPAKKKN